MIFVHFLTQNVVARTVYWYRGWILVIGLASLKLGNLFTSDAIMIRVFGNTFNKDDIFIKIPTFRPYCNLSLAKLESELPR